jgi:hypothetical protein
MYVCRASESSAALFRNFLNRSMATFQERCQSLEHVWAWRRAEDHAWAKMAGLMWFYDDLTTDVNVEWCRQFAASLPTHPGVIGDITGRVADVPVIWRSAWANLRFGWTGDGVSAWGAATCPIPRPDCASWAGEADRGCYETAAIARIKGNDTALRVRAVMAAFFFRGNCKTIREDHLQVIMLADAGIKVNWGMLFNKSVTDELRHIAEVPTAPTPMGPFLTTYITWWLNYVRKHQSPPIIGRIQDVYWDLECSRQNLALLRPSLNPRKCPRRDDGVGEDLNIASNSSAWESTRNVLELALHNVHAAAQDFVNVTTGYESRIQHLEDEVRQHSSEVARLVRLADEETARATAADTEVASNTKVIDFLRLQLEAEAEKARAATSHTPLKECIRMLEKQNKELERTVDDLWEDASSSTYALQTLRTQKEGLEAELRASFQKIQAMESHIEAERELAKTRQKTLEANLASAMERMEYLQLSLANVRTRRDQVAEEAERTSSRVEAVDEEDSKTTAILVPGSHTQELGAAAGGAKATTMARLLEARPVPAGQSKTVAKSADSVLEPTPSADGKLASTATKPGADLPIMESGSIPESSTKPQEGVMSGGTSTAAVMGIQGTCPQSLERQRNAEKGDASTVTLQSGATEMATPAEVRPEARPRNEASRRITISEILSLRVLSSMSSQ